MNSSELAFLRRLQNARVPKRYWNIERSSFSEETEIRKKFFSFLDEWLEQCRAGPIPSKGAYLCSQGPGVGKTAIISYVIKETIKSGRSAVLVTESIWQDLLNPSIVGSDDDPNDFLYWVRRANLVAIDDIGVLKPSDWAVGQWASLIDSLYTRSACVWTSSNFSPWDLSNRLLGDTRIESRLVQMSEQIFDLSGEDYRIPYTR